MRGLVDAAVTTLEQLASEPRVAVVTGRRSELGERFADVAPARWVVAPGRQSRLAVGAGLALGGRAAVVWCDDPGDARAAPWELAAPLVALTDSAEVADGARGAGVPVVMPAWPADVAPLLLAAIDEGRACVRLHGDEAPAGPPLALELPGLTAPRTIMHGPTGRVRAAGAAVPRLLEAAWHLARQGRPLTLEQVTCLPAASTGIPEAADGWPPTSEDARALAAGQALVETRGGWEAVALPVDADPLAVAEALAVRLPR